MNAPGYRCALFDLDDTLFDHQFHRRRALAAVRDAAGLPAHVDVASLEASHEKHLQATYRDLLAGRITLEEARITRMSGMLADFGLEARSGLVPECERAYRSAYDAEWRAVPGAVEVLAGLRSAGVRILVITNGRTHDQRPKLQRLGLETLVDDVVISEEVGCEKPAAAFFEAALRRAGVERADAVVVGDLWETDITGAMNAGIDAIWINRYQKTAAAPRVREISGFEPLAQVLELFERPLTARRGR